ncbi:MAG: Type I restriction-modification system methylation subunit, partial [Candidatus Curtissbacteria bacterium GW2011_GWC2_38_9]
MACVLSNGSLSSQTGNEGEIRKNLVENDLVDCIVMLPKQLFYNTGIPACIWFISRKRLGNGDRKREGEILFLDASDMGHLVDRVHREFTNEDIQKIAQLDLSKYPTLVDTRNYFIFSFYTRGMNFADMAILKWSNISDG